MAYSGLSLCGKTAVVIGGTSGIGRTLSKGLAEAGANVVPTGRRRELVESVSHEIQPMGQGSLAMACDVNDRGSLEALRDAVCKQFGRVDILFNCAGITHKTPALEFQESDWNKVLETNLNGAFRACQIFGREMVKQHYGRIINIASMASFVAFSEVAAYSASKAALASLTQSLAVEWARYGVCVNAIAPGIFRTDLNSAMLDGTPRGEEYLLRSPTGRFGKVEELIGAAIFLASDSASFVNGHVLVVDGAFLASGINR